MRSNSNIVTNELFNSMDKNNDGGITRKEFLAATQGSQGVDSVLDAMLVQRQPTTEDPEVEASLFDGAFDNGHIIKGSWLTWHSGAKVRVSFPSPTQIVLDHKGVVYEGKVQQGNIVWGDGDIWRKADTIKINEPEEPFNYWPCDGVWNSGCTIKRDRLTWPSGAQSAITFTSRTTFQMLHKGNTYKGKFQDGRLYWADGDIWKKDGVYYSDVVENKFLESANYQVIQTTQIVQPAKVQALVPSTPSNPQEAALFEGKWSGGAVKGDVLTWPSGKQTRLVFPGHSVIQMDHEGKMHQGLLEKGEVHWDDGDKWTKAGGHATSTTCCFG